MDDCCDGERERRGQGRVRGAVIAEVEEGEKDEICAAGIAAEDYARSGDAGRYDEAVGCKERVPLGGPLLDWRERCFT